MEKLTESKFIKLTKKEMSEINGGLKWGVWKTIKDDCHSSYTQYYNWFGLHGTSDLD